MECLFIVKITDCNEDFFLLKMLVSILNIDDEVNEYCQLETMKGRCRWKSEVILMTSARWGRMKTGRCLNIHPTLLAANGHDPLFIGCSADVLSLFDRKCSGRSECDIRIPDTDLDTVTPCYPDLRRYLDASYTCVKGMHKLQTPCYPDQKCFLEASYTCVKGAQVGIRLERHYVE